MANNIKQYQQPFREKVPVAVDVLPKAPNFT
jgi:hypothetical protein